MAVRSVLIWPSPVLSTVARPVVTFDRTTRALTADLFDTMYAEDGIGLAANQIGVPLRALVVDLDPGRHARHDPEAQAELRQTGFTGPVALINPEIVTTAGSVVGEEGCLSVPGVIEKVRRYAEITVRARDPRGAPVVLEASGLFAVAIQHEIDHLDGRVFVEYLSQLKRDVIRRKMIRRRADAPGLAAP